jgi:hypothetical protein
MGKTKKGLFLDSLPSVKAMTLGKHGSFAECQGHDTRQPGSFAECQGHDLTLGKIYTAAHNIVTVTEK